MTKDPNQQQKLKRLWRRRIFLGCGLLSLIGVVAVRVPVAFEQQNHYRQAQAQLQSLQWKQKLFQQQEQELGWELNWERLQLQNQALKLIGLRKREQILKQLQEQEWDWGRQHELDLEQVRIQEILLERLRAREQELAGKLKRAQVKTQRRVLIQELVQRQDQMLLLKHRMTDGFISIGTVAFGGLVLLLLLLLQRDKTGIPLTGHLVLVLPEECVAELAALLQRLRKQQRPGWFICFCMTQAILALMFGVYVQINFDNGWLPGAGSSQRIDDK